MKRSKQFIFLFVVTLICFGCKLNAQSIPYASFRPVPRLIQNGDYVALVQYINDSGYKANYTLKVRSEGDKITTIFFDEGYIHDGVNNNNYSYSGGYLEPIFDDSNQLIAFQAVVIVITSSIRQFKYIITIPLDE